MMSKCCLILFCLFFVAIACKEKRSDKAGEKMQQFVIDLSRYARQQDPDFIIIPQNGPELAFSYLDPNDGIHGAYLDAVDGLGNEEVFYDEVLNINQERLDMLRQLKPHKPILVADYVLNDSNIPDAIQRNQAEGFLCFPRTGSNHDYTQIPAAILNENSLNIATLSDAQNYLYLISTDNFASKSEMINAIAATNYDVVLIDLFFDDEALTEQEVAQLKTKKNGAGRLVISYINVGAAENFRYYWQEDWKLHHPNWLKKKYEGYDDEYWVKFWKEDWKEIIYGNDRSYIKKIMNAGFDGAYLDNVEAYYFIYFD